MRDLYRNEDFDEEKVPNEWYYFEVMDRTAMLLEHLSSALYNHPGVDEDNAAKLQQVENLLSEVYQWAGQQSFKDDK